MSRTEERASLLESLVAASGDESLRALFSGSPLDRIRSALRDVEEAKAREANGGRLAAEWSEPAFEIEDADAPVETA